MRLYVTIIAMRITTNIANKSNRSKINATQITEDKPTGGTVYKSTSNATNLHITARVILRIKCNVEWRMIVFCVLNAVKKNHENRSAPENHHIAVVALIPLGEKNSFAKEIANNDAITEASKSKHKTTAELR